MVHFNPLPHTRENGRCDKPQYKNRQFQSTPSYEGEHRDELNDTGKAAFQSTPSYEGEPVTSLTTQARQHFNPLPHTRENIGGEANEQNNEISIHSLIRGRTGLYHWLWTQEQISIHSLIRGRTTPFFYAMIKTKGISIHSLIRGRTFPTLPQSWAGGYFNPLPHTRENGAIARTVQRKKYFNPLPHTRENCWLLRRRIWSLYFNPLPHTRENNTAGGV